MSQLAVLAVVFGLKRIAQDGPGPLAVAAVTVGGIAHLAWPGREHLGHVHADHFLWRDPSQLG
jgi:hypothetical protein